MVIPAHALQSIPSNLWHLGSLRGSHGKAIRWVPVSHLAKTIYWEGFTEAGQWVAETADGLVPLDERSFALLLPLLQRPIDQVREELKSALASLSHPEDTAASF